MYKLCIERSIIVLHRVTISIISFLLFRRDKLLESYHCEVSSRIEGKQQYPLEREKDKDLFFLAVKLIFIHYFYPSRCFFKKED